MPAFVDSRIAHRRKNSYRTPAHCNVLRVANIKRLAAGHVDAEWPKRFCQNKLDELSLCDHSRFFLFCDYVMNANAYTLRGHGRLSNRRGSPGHSSGQPRRTLIVSVNTMPAKVRDRRSQQPGYYSSKEGTRRQARSFHMRLTFCSCFFAARPRASFTVCWAVFSGSVR